LYFGTHFNQCNGTDITIRLHIQCNIPLFRQNRANSLHIIRTTRRLGCMKKPGVCDADKHNNSTTDQNVFTRSLHSPNSMEAATIPGLCAETSHQSQKIVIPEHLCRTRVWQAVSPHYLFYPSTNAQVTRLAAKLSTHNNAWRQQNTKTRCRKQKTDCMAMKFRRDRGWSKTRREKNKGRALSAALAGNGCGCFVPDLTRLTMPQCAGARRPTF